MRELNLVTCTFPSGANILCFVLFFPRSYKLCSNQVPSPRLQAAQPPPVRLADSWQPTPGLLPGEPQGRRRPAGCSPWGRRESDATERLHFHFPRLTNAQAGPFFQMSRPASLPVAAPCEFDGPASPQAWSDLRAGQHYLRSGLPAPTTCRLGRSLPAGCQIEGPRPPARTSVPGPLPGLPAPSHPPRGARWVEASPGLPCRAGLALRGPCTSRNRT